MAIKYYFTTVFIPITNTESGNYYISSTVQVDFPVSTSSHDPKVFLQGFNIEGANEAQVRQIQALVSIDSKTDSHCIIYSQLNFESGGGAIFKANSPAYVIASLIDTYEI